MEKAYDTIFDDLLSQLKPLVLKISPREDRQRVTSWVKKFNEPNPNDPQRRKNRNLYAQLLKTMLEKGEIKDPFNSHPPQEPLEPLPSYMSMLLDSNADSASEHHSSTSDNPSKRKLTYTPKKTASLPDLSVMTSDDSDDDINSLLRVPTHRPPTPSSFNFQKMYTSTPGPMKSVQFKGNQSHGIAHIPVKQPIAASSHTTPNYKGIVEKEVQMKERLLSNRYNEQRINIQRHHDELLQKILDKKTKEVEEFRTEYRNKVLQLENNNKTLERRLQQAHEENTRIRELKERQAFDLKNAQNQNNANLKADYENRLTRQNDQNVEGILRLKQEHQEMLQKLIDETTNTMSKMEEEYKEEYTGYSENMNRLLKECEEKNATLRESLDECLKEKRTGEEKLQEAQIEVTDSKELVGQTENRVKELEAELEMKEKKFIGDLETQQKSSQAAGDLAQQEFKYTVNKLQEAVTMLENELKETQQKGEDIARDYDNKIWDLETRSKAELSKVERQAEKRLRVAEKLADKKLAESHGHLTQLKKELRSKEKESEALFQAQKIQNQKAEKSLQELRREMQGNTDRLYKEVQEQVMGLEEDLEAAVHERERLDLEYKRKIGEERLKLDENVAELQMKNEKEKQQLIEKYHSEMEEMQMKYDLDKKRIEEDRLSEINEADQKSRDRLNNEIERSKELQAMLIDLTSDLNEAKASHKKTLTEANTIREKENKQNQLAGEKLAIAHKNEVDDLMKKHAKEIEKLTDKTNSRIKLLEKEFNGRFEENSELLDKARLTAAAQQDEVKRQAIMYEKSIQKLHREIEEATADEAHRHRNIIKALEQEVDTQRGIIRHLEKKLRMSQLEMEEKITRTKLIYEEKMKGVVPMSVREELEETIAALKAQSTILEQKATILQTELDQRSSRTPTGGRTATPKTPGKAQGRTPARIKARG